jgi:hypothetical protein
MRGEAVTRTGYFTIRLTEHRRKILDYIAVHANAGSVFNAPVDLVDYALVHAAMCDRELRTSNGSNLRRAALSIVIRNGKQPPVDGRRRVAPKDVAMRPRATTRTGSRSKRGTKRSSGATRRRTGAKS